MTDVVLYPYRKDGRLLMRGEGQYDGVVFYPFRSGNVMRVRDASGTVVGYPFRQDGRLYARVPGVTPGPTILIELTIEGVNGGTTYCSSVDYYYSLPMYRLEISAGTSFSGCNGTWSWNAVESSFLAARLFGSATVTCTPLQYHTGQCSTFPQTTEISHGVLTLTLTNTASELQALASWAIDCSDAIQVAIIQFSGSFVRESPNAPITRSALEMGVLLDMGVVQMPFSCGSACDAYALDCPAPTGQWPRIGKVVATPPTEGMGMLRFVYIDP